MDVFVLLLPFLCVRISMQIFEGLTKISMESTYLKLNDNNQKNDIFGLFLECGGFFGGGIKSVFGGMNELDYDFDASFLLKMK